MRLHQINYWGLRTMPLNRDDIFRQNIIHNDIETSKFGKRLIEIREEKGRTRKQAAQDLGIFPHTIRAWEAGKYIPNLSSMLEICKVYEITPNELLTFDE